MPRPEGYYLSFDYGTKRMGVAVGQTISCTANPLTTLNINKEGEPDWLELQALIHKWRPKGLVVGVPLKMDDTPLFITEMVQSFITKLQRYQLPIFPVDERLTTKEARSRLYEKGGYKALQNGNIDQIAAVLILEQWFSLEFS